jgi:hypothetical protein
MTKQANKQTAVAVANAEQLLARFQRERDELVEQHEQHTAKRRELSFTAHSGDAQASKLLDGLHDESVRFESRLASITDAINEATRRLEAAKQHEAREADRERALAARLQLAAFVAAGKALDGALEVVVSASIDMRNSITILNKLGVTHPSHAQLDALGSLALRTALCATSWQRYFERVAPNERKRFVDLCAQWSVQVERQISARLGDDPTNNTTEAA